MPEPPKRDHTQFLVVRIDCDGAINGPPLWTRESALIPVGFSSYPRHSFVPNVPIYRRAVRCRRAGAWDRIVRWQLSRWVRWCQGQRTGSRAVSHCCCRNASFILRIRRRINRHGKAASMRAVCNPRSALEDCLFCNSTATWLRLHLGKTLVGNASRRRDSIQETAAADAIIRPTLSGAKNAAGDTVWAKIPK
jgi:hypothetical protein